MLESYKITALYFFKVSLHNFNIQLQSFLNHINDYYALSAEVKDALQDCFVKMEFYKNDFLLQQGNICRYLYFVEKGALRGFYNLDGKEVTHWFGFENDFVTSFHSFITGTAAVENIQFVEYSVLWALPKEKMLSLFDRFHETERLVRIIYEKYYIRLEDRFVNAQFKTAAERYESLLTHTPHILTRVPLGYIAAYLGITQETLSRIRSKV